MSGFEVIGVILGVFPVVAEIVKHFGTQRNAPRQVERLSRMLAELRDERLLLAAMPTEQEHIRDMVNRITDLLESETAAASQKKTIWKFAWSAEAEKRLKEHNDELDRELERLQRRVYVFRSPATGTTPPTTHSPFLDVRTPSPDSREEKPARRGTLSVPGSPQPAAQRRNSVEAVLPTTLCLQNPFGKRISEKLRLQTLAIIERDDMWRRIQYTGTGSDGSEVRITHRIPRGNIWFEDEDLGDLSVSFLEAHDITVENEEGYKVYRAYSVYAFSTVEHREQFLVHVRERQLLGRFLAEKVWEKGDLIAQQKVVRLWKKTAPSPKEMPKITLSFIGRDEKPYERSLGEFHRKPAVRGNRVDLIDAASKSKTTLEFSPSPKQLKRKWGMFGSGSKSSTSSSTTETEGGAGLEPDAARFAAAFEAHHPSTLPAPKLTLSPAFSERFSPDLTERPSPGLPALTPSTSRAPTLSTISIPSAYVSLPADDSPVSPKSTRPEKD